MDEDARETAERLNSILESAVDGILSIDENGLIESVNAAAIELFGYRREEMIGQNVKLLMPLPYRDEHDLYLQNYRESGNPRIIGIGREVMGRHSNGRAFPMYLAVSEGAFRGHRIFTGIVRDLTALRLAEDRAKAAEQLASLSVITAGIAHDIGTPMNVILGYAEMLRDSLDDSKDRRRAEVIAEQVRRVTDLLHTLLNIARPRDAVRSSLAIDEVLDHALDFFQQKLTKRGIKVVRDYASVPALEGDRDRLEQMFLNLIVNAVDAMEGGGELRVSVALRGPSEEGGGTATRDGEHIEIRLADTGHGMEAETRAHIFAPFFSTKDPGKGTGLGLVVAKSIVSDHNGSIECESQVGQGTCFVIRLRIGV